MRKVPLYVALVHYPVLNRRGETIASAVTNLDLHDMARTVCTYDVPACYIVTPLEDQQALCERLLSHWKLGIARELHPARGEALERLRVVGNIGTAIEGVREEWGESPLLWATSARESEGVLSCREAGRFLDESSRPVLLLFGTGWGLAPSVLEDADALLEPIRGANGYNHLSVRCAAAILMDRILNTGKRL
ncbi:MAG: RNA methyltransferase [Syntrophobacteraceae bacterium]